MSFPPRIDLLVSPLGQRSANAVLFISRQRHLARFVLTTSVKCIGGACTEHRCRLYKIEIPAKFTVRSIQTSQNVTERIIVRSEYSSVEICDFVMSFFSMDRISAAFVQGPPRGWGGGGGASDFK